MQRDDKIIRLILMRCVDYLLEYFVCYLMKRTLTNYLNTSSTCLSFDNYNNWLDLFVPSIIYFSLKYYFHSHFSIWFLTDKISVGIKLKTGSKADHYTEERDRHEDLQVVSFAVATNSIVWILLIQKYDPT